jgi:hypothetical protein
MRQLTFNPKPPSNRRLHLATQNPPPILADDGSGMLVGAFGPIQTGDDPPRISSHRRRSYQQWRIPGIPEIFGPQSVPHKCSVSAIAPNDDRPSETGCPEFSSGRGRTKLGGQMLVHAERREYSFQHLRRTTGRASAEYFSPLLLMRPTPGGICSSHEQRFPTQPCREETRTQELASSTRL